MKIKIDTPYKSITSSIEFELPKFTILTGENGSGKTHIFEALNNKNGHIIVDDRKLKSISYIPFGSLNPKIDQRCDPQQISQRVKQLWNELQKSANNNPRPHSTPVTILTPEKDPALSNLRNEQNKDVIIKISKQAGIMPSELTEDIISENINILGLTGNDLFNSQFALIFKAYHVRFIDNKLNKLYLDEGIDSGSLFLNDEQFKSKYGDPPWEFVNSVLERLSLPYKVNNPMNLRRDSTFEFKLFHKSHGIEISTNDLSTGEKTLMSLALAIYNSTGIGDRSDILILDEPDAPLHPSMSKLMLEILEKDIVEKHGIPVIISTHSPTTIACAPASSLYKISATNKVPEQCNLEDSMQILMHGIPNLRVSIEKRRQVFVEHNYDVIYYEKLYEILSRNEEFPTTPQFLPPHTLNGCNCDAVKEITRKLRDMGNTQVYGLIDRDESNEPEKQLVILGMGKRYSIESYIFEPHILGLYLIHKKFSLPGELGMEGCNSYLDVCTKIYSHPCTVQKLADAVQEKIIWPNQSTSTMKSYLLDGTSLRVREEIFIMQGHKFESLCKATWPSLKSVRSNNNGDSALKTDIINTVINDFPGLVSTDLAETFREFQ